MAGPFRYVTPVEPQNATGRTARVYGQLAEDFGMARMAVFLTLSPSPEVQAATWAMLRESLLAGSAPRTDKEVVALGVSMANQCPFCVAAHTTLLHATGDHRLAETVARGDTPADPTHAALLTWAKAPSEGTWHPVSQDAWDVGGQDARHAGAQDARQAGGQDAGPVGGAPAGPYPVEHAHEYIGTALAFHFINRMASALLTDNLMPAGLQRSRLVRSVGGRVMSRAVRRRLRVGTSLALVADLPAGPEPDWAAGTPVGAAYAALEVAATAGGELLAGGARDGGGDARAVVVGVVEAWDGSPLPMDTAWLDGPLAALPADERPGARLALLTALAPYRVTDADVAAWRGSKTDEDLVRLCAFGAITATKRVEALITAQERADAPTTAARRGEAPTAVPERADAPTRAARRGEDPSVETITGERS
ncbi:carboxymuconolactone decarboxylase family protein [Nonomuraea rosea]|uniref:Carboxymuconolactone decarboxylase family protein n=2 Tax=Nonomuraea rosea TaxID=638574 RepID=A0ABP6VZH9_9ACTN